MIDDAKHRRPRRRNPPGLVGDRNDAGAVVAGDASAHAARAKERRAPATSPSRRMTLPLLLILMVACAVVTFTQDVAMGSGRARTAGVPPGRNRLPRGALNNDRVVGSHRRRASRRQRGRQAAQDDSRGLSRSGSVGANASSAFPLPSSEWFEDIDNSSLVGCGIWKCAYQSKRNRGYGYLLSRPFLADDKTLAFSLGRHLSDAFSIRHTLLANATVVNNTKRQKLWVSIKRLKKNKRKLGHFMAVQPIRLYPENSVLFKCTEGGYMEALEAVKNQTFSSALDPRAFEERLRGDLDKTKAMMSSRQAQCLTEDFQLVIEANTGGIMNIDLDRCFQESPKEKEFKDSRWNERCLKRLENTTEYMIAKKYTLGTERGSRRRKYDNLKERVETYNKIVDKFDGQVSYWQRKCAEKKGIKVRRLNGCKGIPNQ